MEEFITKQNNKLMVDLEAGGITFFYITGDDRKGDVFQVAQSWSSIHALLSKLRNAQHYSARDNSLLVWMQDQELCLRFRALDVKLEWDCTFSHGETVKIMDFLERAPNLN